MKNTKKINQENLTDLRGGKPIEGAMEALEGILHECHDEGVITIWRQSTGQNRITFVAMVPSLVATLLPY